jgi:hypothetical protein
VLLELACIGRHDEGCGEKFVNEAAAELSELQIRNVSDVNLLVSP